MSKFSELSQDKLKTALAENRKRYDDFVARNLKLDMTRGKPSPEQLDLSRELLALPGADHFKDEAGTDCRNYGGVEGLPAMRQLFAKLLELAADEVMIGGNSSLTLMHDTVVGALLKGVPDSPEPWSKSSIKFLCPVPGYDRHFAICESFGIEMIPVSMDENGPDMDRVEELVKNDASIKGIWCVPKYSNPSGYIYSDEVVDRLGGMKCAAPDFRIFWDNAYSEHHLGTEPAKLKNILESCRAAGNENRPYIFASTSKITFAGAGVSALGSSVANIKDLVAKASIQTIGPDKINQLRHLIFFKDLSGLRKHMLRHAELLRPRFDAVETTLQRELSESGCASWTKPTGGYFISLDTPSGCARRVVELCAQAGVKLTGAGATFPYKKDPDDCNIRLAPSLPSVNEIEQAMECVGIAVKIAALEKLIG